MSPVNTLELKAEPRAVVGKKVRFLRREGILPANVYGHAASAAIQLAAKEAERVIQRAGKTQLISLAMDGGQPTTVLVKASQRHPTRGSLLHVDFFRVAMDEVLKIDVPVRLVGDAPAVRQHNAVVVQPMSTVSVESLPGELPEAIEIDISGLEVVDSALYVRDLRPPTGVTILSDPEEMVVKMMAPTVEAEPVEVAAEGEEPAAESGQTAQAESEQPAE